MKRSSIALVAIIAVFLGVKWMGTSDVQAETAVDPKSAAIDPKAIANMPAFKKPSRSELKQKLTPLQFKVTQRDGTEPAFRNAYHDNKKPGIYVDIVSGAPLFSSTSKYDSGTGWPSFWAVLHADEIVEKIDRKLFFSKRTEIRSKTADSHLGHVFSDGPAPSGLRYCMNSAALRFIHKDKLEEEGYGAYLALFKQ